ncbi:4Fe-4S dicluster domain-containing protein [Lysobacter brunescens]|uniref:4Fe-4S dicluster domain-containing protein n=1 Tax=Lysobacter brunescens TaxID=262323 RepID=A0ABW2Y9R6_9GAMM
MTKKIPIQLAEDAQSMYVSEKKIHPRDVDGRFQRLRAIAVWVLLGMYYVFPWINWDGRQSVLFDLPARKFHVFGLNFWPQDFVFLALLLIIAGMALFFFTSLAGRLWCGYACPQTVWTEVFIWIEQWAEGDRNKRIKFDNAPWTGEKLRRRGGKHALWLLFALWTGFTFVGFFTPIRELAARAVPFDWSGWETFWVLFYALATWGNAGFLREQVCKYMCPYARFQSAMFDRNTLIIAYDPMRGEPRGPRKKGSLDSVLARARGLLDKATAYDYVFRAAHHHTAADNLVAARGNTSILDHRLEAEPLPKFAPDQLGDCIDCTICVQVCPTGIDIRNGLQYECIACGACIDACNEVMDKVGYPRGLIRYSTQNAIDGKPSKVLRPRIVVYGLLLLALLVGWGWGVTHRSPLIAEVLRDRNALYREARDGGIENGYTLKLINKTREAQTYRIEVQSADGIALRGGAQTVRADAEEVLTLPLVATAPGSISGKHTLRFVIQSGDGETRREVDASFFGPSP